jgi:O-antigen ligase
MSVTTPRAARPTARGPARVTVGSVPVALQLAWGALVLNVLAFSAMPTIIPIPLRAGQLVTQGALLAALALALVANRRMVVRPTLFLTLLAILGVMALMVSPHNEFPFGSVFRAVRFLVFILVLWVLTPWWGRRDMVLLRCHRRALWVVLCLVLVGAAISPGLAFQFEGRMAGVLWPVPPTQVAHYSAVLLGTSIVLWMSRVITTWHAVVATSISAVALIASHSRTALAAATVGVVVAGASLFVGHVRVRRTYVFGSLAAVAIASLFASELTKWLLRGQSYEEAGQLTGRTKVWTRVLEHPRSPVEQLVGSGPSDQSFDGLPIDNNWLATYLDQGWFGVVVHAALVLVLLVLAVTHVRGPQRAVALFLIVFCVVASFTETGLFTATAYLLDLAVAASLLAPEQRRSAR